MNTGATIQVHNIAEKAVMIWFDPSGDLVEQLSALPTEVLEEALDRNLERVEQCENNRICPGCGTAYVSDAHPAQGANPDYENAMIWEPNCPNTCPL